MKNPFKKEMTSYQSELPESPYLRAQQEWDARIGSARAQARSWRVIALFSLLLAIFLVVLLYLTLVSKKDRVFVAEVTSTGRVVNVAPLVMGYHPTLAQEEYFISQFIELVRSLPLDPVVAKNNWLKAYGYVIGRGTEQLNTAFRQNNPVDLLGKKTVTIKITAINPVSNSTFEVEWSENTVNASGQDEGQKNFGGVFTIVLRQPLTQQEILLNPLGIHIVDFHVSSRT